MKIKTNIRAGAGSSSTGVKHTGVDETPAPAPVVVSRCTGY